MRPILPLLLLVSAAAAAAQGVAPPPSVTDWARLLVEDAWSLALRVERADHDGMRDSRDDVSRAALFAAGYDVYTDELTSQRARLHFAHGLDGCTLFASLPLVDLERRGQTAAAARVEQQADGIGDLQLGLTRLWWEDRRARVVWSLALSLPTGSVDETDGGALLPYPLQPGSGTVDLQPAVAWTCDTDGASYGLALRGRVHLGRNSQDWARSDSQVFDAWIGHPLNGELDGRLVLRHGSWGDLHGAAMGLNPALDPLDDDFRQGGARTDLLVGVDWRPGDGDTVLEVEIGVPVDEWLDGPQASAELVASLGVRFGW